MGCYSPSTVRVWDESAELHGTRAARSSRLIRPSSAAALISSTTVCSRSLTAVTTASFRRSSTPRRASLSTLAWMSSPARLPSQAFVTWRAMVAVVSGWNGVCVDAASCLGTTARLTAAALAMDYDGFVPSICVP